MAGLIAVYEASAEALAEARQQIDRKQASIDNYAAELAGTRGLLHNANAQIAVKDHAIHALETRKRNLVEENAALHKSIEELKAKLTDERREPVCITTGSDGEILAVTRQDADGKVLEVLAQAPERPRVSWSIDQGRDGDGTCVSIVKHLPNGISVVLDTVYVQGGGRGLSLAQARELRHLAQNWLRASLYAAGKNNTVDTIAAIEKRKAFFAALTELTTPAAGNDTARIAELEKALQTISKTVASTREDVL